MTLDANGVWQYDEFETVSPFSTMLNRLAGSVSTQLGPLVPFATAPLTMTGGATNQGSYAWRRGNLAGVIFNFDKGTNVTNTTVGTLAPEFRAPWEVTVALDANGADPGRIFMRILAAGEMRITFYGGDNPGARLRGSSVWPVSQ